MFDNTFKSHQRKQPDVRSSKASDHPRRYNDDPVPVPSSSASSAFSSITATKKSTRKERKEVKFVLTDFGKKSNFSLRPCRYGFTPNLGHSSWKTFNKECLWESQEIDPKINSPNKASASIHEEKKVV